MTVVLPDDATRDRLRYYWGPEIVLECCRTWLTHGTQWGLCGLCREFPKKTTLTWEQALEMTTKAPEIVGEPYLYP